MDQDGQPRISETEFKDRNQALDPFFSSSPRPKAQQGEQFSGVETDIDLFAANKERLLLRLAPGAVTSCPLEFATASAPVDTRALRLANGGKQGSETARPHPNGRTISRFRTNDCFEVRAGIRCQSCELGKRISANIHNEFTRPRLLLFSGRWSFELLALAAANAS